MTHIQLRHKFENKWVMKKGFTLFHSIWPVIRVGSVGFRSKNNTNVILHKHGSGMYHRVRMEIPIDSLVVISNEEAQKILKLYEECKIISNCRETEFSHIREDNGEEKIRYTLENFSGPLFRLRMKYPDKSFSAYKCPVCGSIHLGKNTIEISMEDLYPEHTKSSAAYEKSQIQLEFLEWLESNGYKICNLSEYDDNFYPTNKSNDELLRLFHGIDSTKLSLEKKQMLSKLKANV